MKKIFLSHHWIVSLRGGEKVLLELLKLFPNAAIGTLVFNPKLRSHFLLAKIVVPFTILNNILIVIYKYIPFLHPFLIRNISYRSDCELIISNDASLIKSIPNPKMLPHICYCLSPPRYIWDLTEEYLSKNFFFRLIQKFLMMMFIPCLRRYDFNSSKKVDHFIAISKLVSERIQKYYCRESTIIHPPVAVDEFAPTKKSENFYLIVSQLTPYKRVDLAIDAFNKMELNLVVIGEGSEYSRLLKMSSDKISMLGHQPFSVVKDMMERCRAFIYPQIEDFGITAVEAQAAGKPVIAFRYGGALDTVIENHTGIFFEQQTSESLAKAVLFFENYIKINASFDQEGKFFIPVEKSFSSEICRKNAIRFNPDRFRDEIKKYLNEKYPKLFKDYCWPV